MGITGLVISLVAGSVSVFVGRRMGYKGLSGFLFFTIGAGVSGVTYRAVTAKKSAQLKQELINLSKS